MLHFVHRAKTSNCHNLSESNNVFNVCWSVARKNMHFVKTGEDSVIVGSTTSTCAGATTTIELLIGSVSTCYASARNCRLNFMCYLMECGCNNQDEDDNCFDNLMGIILDYFKLVQLNSNAIFI